MEPVATDLPKTIAALFDPREKSSGSETDEDKERAYGFGRDQLFGLLR
jgi:hypothetical protein